MYLDSRYQNYPRRRNVGQFANPGAASQAAYRAAQETRQYMPSPPMTIPPGCRWVPDMNSEFGGELVCTGGPTPVRPPSLGGGGGMGYRPPRNGGGGGMGYGNGNGNGGGGGMGYGNGEDVVVIEDLPPMPPPQLPPNGGNGDYNMQRMVYDRSFYYAPPHIARNGNQGPMTINGGSCGGMATTSQNCGRYRTYPLSFRRLVPAGQTVDIQTFPQKCFKGNKLIISGTNANQFLVVDILVGTNSQSVAAGGIPGEAFQAGTQENLLDLDWAYVGLQIVLRVQNLDGVNDQQFNAAIIGTTWEVTAQ